MESKKFLTIILMFCAISALLTEATLFGVSASQRKFNTQSVEVRSVGQSIIAQGEVHSQQEAVLHFQTGGKVIYLPFKEGDAVYAGQTIAQLDTYPLQQQLTQALNAYKISRDTFDQTQDNVSNSILQNQQKANLEGKNLGMPTVAGLNADDNLNNTVTNIVKRIVDEGQAGLNNAVINVQLANYAMQLASIQAPFDGIVMHEDISNAYQNVTPATSFAIADPNHVVFRATVSSNDIDFVSVGSSATISLTGGNKISGTVSKIYPQRMTMANGSDVYQVEITADGLQGVQLGQTGVASISSSNTRPTGVVPTWTIVGHNYIWILENGKPEMKKVVLGPSHGNETEIYGGLQNGDKVITNPNGIAAEHNIVL